MNVQCVVLVVDPVRDSESRNSIPVEANFFFSQTIFVMNKERTMRAPKARSYGAQPLVRAPKARSYGMR